MRPKRKMADDANVHVSATVRVTNKEELENMVLQLHAQAQLDRAMWAAVEEAFDTHATRIEALSHQDLQWNAGFAKTFDGVRKGMDQMDTKVNQQIGQVVADLTATVRQAESDLTIAIKEADGEFAKFRRETEERVAWPSRRSRRSSRR